MDLSIIIPSYNEQSRIEKTLQEIFTYLKNKNYSYEIIVVDDGSTDDTVKIVNKFSVTLLKNEKNKGKGYSVKRGMLAAKGDLRLFMDADHSVSINNLDVFVEQIKSADIVIASIEIPGAKIEDDNHWYRRVLGRISKKLIRLTATPGIYDTQRGFKLFTKKAAETLFPLQTIDRWGFDIEILVMAQRKGFKIKELPVQWQNSKDSKVSIWSYFVTLGELIRISFLKI